MSVSGLEWVCGQWISRVRFLPKSLFRPTRTTPPCVFFDSSSDGHPAPFPPITCRGNKKHRHKPNLVRRELHSNATQARLRIASFCLFSFGIRKKCIFPHARVFGPQTRQDTRRNSIHKRFLYFPWRVCTNTSTWCRGALHSAPLSIWRSSLLHRPTLLHGSTPLPTLGD